MTERTEIKLSSTQRLQLENLESDILWLNKEIKKAELAGIDVTDSKTKVEELGKLRGNLLQLY
jgi:hypothetical protein